MFCDHTDTIAACLHRTQSQAHAAAALAHAAAALALPAVVTQEVMALLSPEDLDDPFPAGMIEAA